jgi:hypothetical protein
MNKSLSEEKLIQLLKLEFQRRRMKNPRYSIRAFANSLDLDQSLLGKVMGSRVKMGPQYSLHILKKLAKNNAALICLLNSNNLKELEEKELIGINYYILIEQEHFNILKPSFESWGNFLDQQKTRGKLDFSLTHWMPSHSPFEN